MGNHERILAAYLFLCALEKGGIAMISFDIHMAWIAYCQNMSRNMAGSDLLGAAESQGFQL